MKMILAMAILALGLHADAADPAESNAASTGNAAVWAGLDYSMVRMIGPNDFRDASSIFPGMLEAWNELFIKERIGRLSHSLGRQVLVDVGGMTQRNAKATAKQIIPSGGPEDVITSSHITPEQIAEAVKSYKLENKSGLGLVFIVDRLIKPTANGAVYVVFFDVASRKVLSSERRIGRAGGFGFRNYWFGVIKQVDSKVKSPS